MTFKERLLSINGIGPATADSIIKEYSTRDSFLHALKDNNVDVSKSIIKELKEEFNKELESLSLPKETVKGSEKDRFKMFLEEIRLFTQSKLGKSERYVINFDSPNFLVLSKGSKANVVARFRNNRIRFESEATRRTLMRQKEFKQYKDFLIP